MSLARFLVCEKTGRWAVALRRERTGSLLRVYETRGFVECRRELERSPASFVAMELTVGNAARLADWIERVSRELPESRIAVLGQRDAALYEGLVREAGAICVTFSPRQLGAVVRMAEQCLAAAPEVEQTFREQVRKRLPWKAPR